MTKTRATTELILAGALWGLGFVATIWALREFTAVETLVYRFVLAILAGEILFLAFHRRKFLTNFRHDFALAIPAGVCLASMLLVQTIGLKYTTATKSGFLTSLYVIFVPIINTWFFGYRGTLRNYLLAGLALVGTFILMNSNLSNMNTGDLWTLACAVLAALHIIAVGKATPQIQNAFRFNNFQSFWCLLVLLPFLFLQNQIKIQINDPTALWGVFFLALGSSLVGFYLQIRAQKTLSDSTASMLFLLESPFAALFGFLILSERLEGIQLLGAGIILMASLLQILFDPASKTKQMKSE